MPWILHLFFSQFKKTNQKILYIQKYWGKKQGTFLIVEVGFHFFLLNYLCLNSLKKKCFNDIVEYFYTSLMGRLKKWSRGWKKTYLACVIDLSIHRRLACECHGLPHLALKVHGCMKWQYQQGAIMAWVKVKYSPQSKNAYVDWKGQTQDFHLSNWLQLNQW